ncbi:NAD(P)/FAD-dependent oxidoreductase [Chitinophaga pinensis]|uniref:FAD-dependent pyridine nucleotide-disulphide oxidoreductase n=1 Tax=Chitinophaga pinensis (strain ATCC 43595 / DSM 2588 / LMG 13176 / NBRC 15968 / NCIMB 11800 / UQM 2034) TaxID=485918 RepID=A0A979GSF9_CHIPD|nr:NAD(P)/FAD-dependent oxidoreductase [Chitinophaga pinensis]ACU63052.1 FAD-dependent pyridine nucleotide-disulphide oxidoreductase [Chitinophaga pinensis DSM 2588]
MINEKQTDVIIIGGSYAGLAAAMALGRALKNVMIIDSGLPCNRQTPYSHNFLTQDGQTPANISAIARQQVAQYPTVQFLNDLATDAVQTGTGFNIRVASGDSFQAHKLIFATGIRDILPDINGLSDCWGISVLHCPFCHGYEVREAKTGVLGDGDYGLEFSRLIRNWTTDLTLFTNGSATLTPEQYALLQQQHIPVVEKRIRELVQENGYIRHIVFEDGTTAPLTALYTHAPFEQHCPLPEKLGCACTTEGYLITDHTQQTTIPGVFACGDNTTRLRTIANAVSMGTAAGIAVTKSIKN